MNRRLSSRITRILAILLALWLPLLLAEPVPMHSCPMHQAEQTQIAAAATHSQHAAHSAHQHHAATTQTNSAQDHTQHQDHPNHPNCSCIGQCSSAAVNTVPTISTFELSFIVAELTAQLPIFQSAAFVSPDYILPFANGPPPPPSLA